MSTQHTTREEAIEVIKALPGYITHLLGTTITVRTESNGQPVSQRCTQAVEYAQTVGTGYKWRTALVTEESTVDRHEDNTESVTPTVYHLDLPLLLEAPCGTPYVVVKS